MHYSPAPMHIPDGFLSLAVSILFWVVSVVVIALAIRNINKELDEKQIPLMAFWQQLFLPDKCLISV